MNRRTFVGSLSASVVASLWLLSRNGLARQTTFVGVESTPEPNQIPVQAFAQREFALNGIANPDQFSALQVLVEQFQDIGQADLAFDERVRGVPIPEAPIGEFSLISGDAITTIDGYAFPVFLQTHSIIAGAAAVTTSYATAVTQRSRHIWTVHTRSGPGNDRMPFIRSMMEPLLRNLITQQIEGSELWVDDEGISHGGLWDLLPDLGELPHPMQMVTQDASMPELGEPEDDPD